MRNILLILSGTHVVAYGAVAKVGALLGWGCSVMLSLAAWSANLCTGCEILGGSSGFQACGGSMAPSGLLT